MQKNRSGLWLLFLLTLLITVGQAFSQEALPEEYYESGQIKAVGKYMRNGTTRTGEWIDYYESGQVYRKSNWAKMGSKYPIGLFKEFYENGQIYKVGSYNDDGFPIGEWRRYHQGGSIKSLKNYNDEGYPSGEWKFSYEDREMMAYGNYAYGEKSGEWRYYYTNWKLKEIRNYSKGRLIGEWQYFYENGQVQEIGSFAEDRFREYRKVGEWRFYHDNGELMSIGEYYNGNAQGEWKIYFSNGNLSEIGTYSNDKRSGEWKKYHQNGTLYQVQLWVQGKLMQVLYTCNNKGDTLEAGTLVDGNGILYEYSPDGKLIGEIPYLDGIRPEQKVAKSSPKGFTITYSLGQFLRDLDDLYSDQKYRNVVKSTFLRAESGKLDDNLQELLIEKSLSIFIKDFVKTWVDQKGYIDCQKEYVYTNLDKLSELCDGCEYFEDKDDDLGVKGVKSKCVYRFRTIIEKLENIQRDLIIVEVKNIDCSLIETRKGDPNLKN